jgi:uncharacterized protein YjhX (UPF0386 family)
MVWLQAASTKTLPTRTAAVLMTQVPYAGVMRVIGLARSLHNISQGPRANATRDRNPLLAHCRCDIRRHRLGCRPVDVQQVKRKQSLSAMPVEVQMI